MPDAGGLNQPQTQRKRRLHKHQPERRLPPGQPQPIAALTEKEDHRQRDADNQQHI
ncbi:hypothetical protein KPC142_01193 [Klebsiella quasipneumoniae]|nr:hypothetical protein KPC142_01193 [Klebsiella quasipneumoniae]